MNNSFPRIIDGMCATLRAEVLPRLDDEFARGQVFGVINLLNTFKVRGDWSAGFLLQQLAAQQAALAEVTELARTQGAQSSLPTLPELPIPQSVPIGDLLQMRDSANAAIGALLLWLAAERDSLGTEAAQRGEAILRTAMRAEIDLELKNSPRPLFAEMSSGTES